MSNELQKLKLETRKFIHSMGLVLTIVLYFFTRSIYFWILYQTSYVIAKKICLSALGLVLQFLNIFAIKLSCFQEHKNQLLKAWLFFLSQSFITQNFFMKFILFF